MTAKMTAAAVDVCGHKRTLADFGQSQIRFMSDGLEPLGGFILTILGQGEIVYRMWPGGSTSWGLT
jgi:hypothetical protein